MPPTRSSSSVSPNALVGRRVQKFFYVDEKQRKRQLFDGRVEAYDRESNHFRVVYEDGDSEDVTRDELGTMLVTDGEKDIGNDNDNDNSGNDATTVRPPPRVVTPGEEEQDSIESPLNVASSPSRRTRRRLNYAETSDNDDDGDDYLEEVRTSKKTHKTKAPKKEDDDDEFVAQEDAEMEDGVDVIEILDDDDDVVKTAVEEDNDEVEIVSNVEAFEDAKPKAKTTRNTRKKAPAKAPQRKASRKKTLSKRKSDQLISPRSIAARGLPQGSRAVGRGGFEVRSLDGIPPLLTKESVTKAIKLVSTGQHQAAARLLATEHHSIQAFCQAASTRLKIPTTTATRLQGGSPLSERARERLQQGLASVDAGLPGRLLVVRAGTALVESKDGGGSSGKPKLRPLCPPELVGRVFDSAQALQTEAGTKDLATYSMDAMGDAAFGPWSVVVQRLEAGGLLPSAEASSEGDSPNVPYLVKVEWDGSDSLPKGTWQVYDSEKLMNEKEEVEGENSLQWGLLEGAIHAPPVVVGVSSLLLAKEKEDRDDTSSTPPAGQPNKAIGLLPELSPEASRVRLPASLLQKAIRRNFCSPAPVLEACRALLVGDDNVAPSGGVKEMLMTTWKGMLEDSSPFDSPDDNSMLGLEQLLLLSLVGMVDTEWMLPHSLLLKAVATALRTQQQPASFNIDQTPDTKDGNKADWSLQAGAGRPVELRNALMVMRAVVGFKIVQRSSIEKGTSISDTEALLVSNFDRGMAPPKPEPRLQNLDKECRLAAYDNQVSPNCLLLLQASLNVPPTSWRKHSLPAIARQVNYLVSNVNARLPDHHHLTRIAAWGRNANSTQIRPAKVQDRVYDTARECVTSTGTLSDKELEIIDCFEAVQNMRAPTIPDGAPLAATQPTDSVSLPRFRRAEAGEAPSLHHGRIAFLLAFAKAEEIEVSVPGGPSEVVNVLFCGDAHDPLLVQRIGKAREEAALTSAGPEAGSSGAKAVPSLGYVQRSRSEKDRKFVEAAERAVAKKWHGGRTVSLPLPPPRFQWSLPRNTANSNDDEEEAEKSVALTATLENPGCWKFSIGGVEVEPFDARLVISACSMTASLTTENHKHAPLYPELERLLQIVLYVEEGCKPQTILHSFIRLHGIACEARSKRSVEEGLVYDWLPLAYSSKLTATIWRDALLALKTREKDDVVLGPVLSDGTCTRDMTEGAVFRIYSVLGCLYPTVLFKTGALKWRIRPRGAGYHHMLDCLEQLSRQSVKLGGTVTPAANPTTVALDSQPPTTKRRTRRSAAVKCIQAVASCADAEEDKSSGQGKEDPSAESEKEDLSLPIVTTKLWPHQEASVQKIVEGVKQGRRGHADASAVGAGKTLTALGAIAGVAAYMENNSMKRNGVLVMLPTKALIREWLLQIAEHTSGWQIAEQREDGQLFSLTYAKSNPPIDGNTLVISTLDRVREHPFVRQAAWDFVCIDECLAVQNAAAKRCPSAWRQVEIATFGVLMLSATFFRSKYSDLFYMIRMLRTPFPRSMEWLSTTIHEHIVCQIPESDRSWTMEGFPVSLPPADLKAYRAIVEAFKRKQLNNEARDCRRLFSDLETFLRAKYEGRENRLAYSKTSVMADAFVKVCQKLLKQGKRPLVFADTANEAKHILNVLRARSINAREWSSIARESIVAANIKSSESGVIVAVKSVEGQGVNMQHHADAIVCRPTPGDHLEQMKGRVDRPGQASKKLSLTVIMAEHTIEEAKYANIHLAGNFFREFIAPVAHRYRERIDVEAIMAAGGSEKLKTGTVSGVWKKSLEAAGSSGAFASISGSSSFGASSDLDSADDEETPRKSSKGKAKSAGTAGKKKNDLEEHETSMAQDDGEPKFAPRNKVLRNKGDPEAVREAKVRAKNGKTSLAVQKWLSPPKKPRTGLPKVSLKRFSDAKPPSVLDSKTIHKAVEHLSRDPVLGKIIQRVGADALIQDCGDPKPPTQAGLFDSCIRAITFTMVSVDAGNAFMRKFAIKVGVCVERMLPEKREGLLSLTLKQMREGGMDCADWDTDKLLGLLLAGKGQEVLFTPDLVGALVETCLVLKGKRSGYPHLCGESYPCGKNDNHEIFLQKAREHAGTGSVQVSVSYSAAKAGFIISLVDDFKSNRFSAKKIAKVSDREAAKMLLDLKGIGDWCVGSILMNKLNRADICQYGDLTVRNGLNDLFEINHNEESETHLESAADFPDTAENRNLIDELAARNGWQPYRSIITLLMYHLQEENLVLL